MNNLLQVARDPPLEGLAAQMQQVLIILLLNSKQTFSRLLVPVLVGELAQEQKDLGNTNGKSIHTTPHALIITFIGLKSWLALYYKVGQDFGAPC